MLTLVPRETPKPRRSRRPTTAALAPDGKPWPAQRSGFILALAKVGRVEPNGGRNWPWRVPGEWGIKLESVIRLRPIRHRGGRGWRVLQRNDPTAWQRLEEQLEAMGKQSLLGHSAVQGGEG